jgi:ABC-type phosphate transport system ATPase subunit
LNTPLEEVRLEIERELAKQRQSKAGELFGRGKNSLGSNDPKLSEGQARDIVAKAVALSPRLSIFSRLGF